MRGRALVDLAHELRVSLATLRRRFDVFLRNIPAAPTPTSAADCLLLDGFWFRGKHGNRGGVVLIATAGKKVVSFAFARSESLRAWRDFIATLPQPLVVVTDGNTGLCRAIAELWPNARHQRCLVHIGHESRKATWSVRKDELGKQLNALRKKLTHARTPEQARLYIEEFLRWGKQNRATLQHREKGVDKIGRRHNKKYTNSALQAGYAHLEKALPSMFVYLHHENGEHTTNFLEGGINTGLRDLLRRHRGMPLARQKALIAHFLLAKCG